jgi:hypothetical protein
MDNTGQIVAKTPKQQFVENVQKWSMVEEKLKRVNETAKQLRDMKSELSKSITAYMGENNLSDKKISLQSGELRLVDKKEYTPLSFTYVELCLDNIITDKVQVELIMSELRDQREVNIIKELRHYEK